MFKKSLFTVIFFIVAYQIYIYYLDQEINNNIDDEIYDEEKQYAENIEERKPMVYETPNSFVHPVLGKPTKIIPEGYLFIIKNPQPWNAVVFNQNKENNYLFIIKIPKKLGNIKPIVSKWNEIIKGIQINEENELIIPSIDENSALAILNLMLNNIKGDLSLDNIINNNLIDISIAKIKHYSSIRSKILEQILDSISGDNYNVEESLEYQEDLADTVENKVELKHNHVEERSEVEKNVIEELSEVNNIVPKYNSSGPIPYEGNEFSYI